MSKTLHSGRYWGNIENKRRRSKPSEMLQLDKNDRHVKKQLTKPRLKVEEESKTKRRKNRRPNLGPVTRRLGCDLLDCDL